MADIHVLSKYNEIADSAKSENGPFRQLAEFYCFCALCVKVVPKS